MKITPIIMSAPMVRAFLEGRKTQTRRIIKPQPADDIEPHEFPNRSSQGWISSLKHERGGKTAHFCPYGKHGDLLWVRESFCIHKGDDKLHKDQVSYKTEGFPFVFKPSIHMPRWASRLTLKITEVRAERLQDISEADAIAEGISVDSSGHAIRIDDKIAWGSARGAYAALWESLHGNGAWDSNPWVWAISFKVHKQNIDKFLKGAEA